MKTINFRFISHLLVPKMSHFFKNGSSAKHDYDKSFILTSRNFGLFLTKTIPELYSLFPYLYNYVSYLHVLFAK